MLQEADIVFNMRNDHHLIFKSNPSKFVQAVIDLINQDKCLKKLQRFYLNIKLHKDHNIFSEIIKDGEFKLIVIKSDDNQMSHAVCLTNKYIFDSNTPKCLPLTIDGINCCCGVKNYFIGIALGYHFKLRPTMKKRK